MEYVYNYKMEYVYHYINKRRSSKFCDITGLTLWLINSVESTIKY